MPTSLFGVDNFINANVEGTLVTQSFVATAGQTLFNITNFTYTVATNSLMVYKNGLRLVVPRNFLETSSTSFTLVVPATAGDFIDILGFPELDIQAVTPGSIIFGNGYTLAQYVSDQFINVKAYPYNAVGDGIADDSIPWANAILAGAGKPIYGPTGQYRITTGLAQYIQAYIAAFGPGLKIFGDGPLKTVFDNQFNGPLFSLTTSATPSVFRGAIGAQLENFNIIRTLNTTGGVGIYMTGAYNILIRQVFVRSQSSHGIQIACILGDNDGSNMVSLEHVRCENNAGWGIKADADPGHNEISFISLKHVFMQGNGTAPGIPTYIPASGGLIWSGQICHLEQVGFTINQNVGFFVPGQAGLAQTLDITNTTIENNFGRGLFVRGINSLTAQNIQFHSNDLYTSTNLVEFEAGSYTIKNVQMDGVVVRATSGNNPCTAFKISGTNAELSSCRVDRVVWDNFDYPGQVRFDGWQFDQINNDCELAVISAASVVYRPRQGINSTGNKSPIRLAGGFQVGGVPSTTGEWDPITITSKSLNLAGILATVRYYVYLYDNLNVPTLEASSVAGPVLDAVSGYQVKSGDATRYYVGSVMGGASNGIVLTTGVGWLNPMLIPSQQTGLYNASWINATNKLMLKIASTTLPTSDADGIVVGTQT